MSGFLGELIGMMILIILGDGVCAGVNLTKSYAKNSGWVVIAIGWGLAVAMGVYAVGRFSGAHLNPAVTLGLAALGSFPWSKVPAYLAGQMIGGFLGGCIVYLHYLPHWKETKDQKLKLSVFCTAPAIKQSWANLLSEIIGTFVLVLGIIAIGANRLADGFNPFLVGLLILVIGVSLGGTTGYAINPARDLAPRIAHAVLPIDGKGGSNWGYAWVPIVGPIIGGVFGALFYKAFFLDKITIGFWIFAVIIALVVIAAIAGSKSHASDAAVKKSEIGA